MRFVKFTNEWGSGTYWINVSRIISLSAYSGVGTQIEIAGCRKMHNVKEDLSVVLEMIRSVGGKVAVEPQGATEC